MKTKLFLAIAFGLAISISSCDFVHVPDQPGSGAIDTSSTAVVRKVLLEDYTGHKCPNCPAATIVANSIIAANGDKVVVIGVHAGYFANPMTSGTQYLTDFKTVAGTSYDTYFGISISLPNGMVNRKYYTSTTTAHVLSSGSWATEVAVELAKPALAKLEIVNNYNSTTQTLNCDVSSTFLYDTLTGGPYKLIVVATQDSITADQLDGGVYVPAYIHRHVLRDNFNGVWGDDLATGAIIANLAINKSYTYTFPATYPSAGGTSATSFNASRCHIVAFIYNDVTKEVIQVEEKKLIP